MILEWYLFLRLSLEIIRKILGFMEKPSYVKDVCAFFYLNDKKVIQSVYQLKYIENEIFNSTSYKTKQNKTKKRERSKDIIQLQNHHFWNSWKIVTSYNGY